MTAISEPVAAVQTVRNTGVIVAVVVVCVVVLVALALLITLYLKKSLVRRGKLYMDAISVSVSASSCMSAL